MAHKSYKGVIPGKTIDTSGTSGLDTATQAHALVTGEQPEHQGASAPRTARPVVTGATVDTTDTSVRNLTQARGEVTPEVVEETVVEEAVSSDESPEPAQPQAEEPQEPAKASAEEKRPAGWASETKWREFRLSQGYTEEELDGKGRDELRGLEDR